MDFKHEYVYPWLLYELFKTFNYNFCLSFRKLWRGSSTPKEVDPVIQTPAQNTQPSCSISGSNTFNCDFIYDGLQREFFIYVPTILNDKASVLFSLHGYGSYASWNMQYTGYRSLADNNNFLAIFPQGTVHPTKGGTHWNIGAFTSGSSVNDLGFIQYIIDWLKDTYNFNHDRIYANGMSNGGFMTITSHVI